MSIENRCLGCPNNSSCLAIAGIERQWNMCPADEEERDEELDEEEVAEYIMCCEGVI